jgi:hypothetical protein
MSLIGIILGGLIAVNPQTKETKESVDPNLVSDRYEALISASAELAQVFHREVQSDRMPLSHIESALRKTGLALMEFDALVKDREYWEGWQSTLHTTRWVSGIGAAIWYALSINDPLSSGTLVAALSGFFMVNLIADKFYFEPKLEEVEEQLKKEVVAAKALMANLCVLVAWAKEQKDADLEYLKPIFASFAPICNSENRKYFEVTKLSTDGAK